MGSIKDNKSYRGVPFKDQQREMMNAQRDRAYLHAFRNGFNKDYCSGRGRKLSPEEITEYEKSRQ